MEIYLNSRVNFADGPCGRIKRVVINRLSHQLTHLVVSVEDGYPSERLVPLRWVVGAGPSWIQLGCTADRMDLLTPFTEVEWSAASLFHAEPLLDEYLMHKLLMRPHFCVTKRKRIAPDELAVRRGARVKAADGRGVGRLERIAVDLEDGRITQLMLRSGPIWNPRMVSVPFAAIDEIGDNAVSLRLDRRDVAALSAAVS
jgi:sporulation protein YlmC with PRC-barrel domain